MRQVTIATKGTWAWMGIPGIERAEANGRLWATLYTGGPKEPDPDNVVLLTTSADDGATWSAPQVVAAPPAPTRAYDPCLWYDPAGRLWLFYNHARRATDGEGGADFSVWAMVADDASSDDASSTTPAWSPPRRLALLARGGLRRGPLARRRGRPVAAGRARRLHVPWRLPDPRPRGTRARRPGRGTLRLSGHAGGATRARLAPGRRARRCRGFTSRGRLRPRSGCVGARTRLRSLAGGAGGLRPRRLRAGRLAALGAWIAAAAIAVLRQGGKDGQREDDGEGATRHTERGLGHGDGLPTDRVGVETVWGAQG